MSEKLHWFWITCPHCKGRIAIKLVAEDAKEKSEVKETVKKVTTKEVLGRADELIDRIREGM